MIYIVLYFTVLMILLLTQSDSKYCKLGVKSIFVLLFFFSGFRNEVGVDYNNYVELFDEISLGHVVDVKEHGFVWIMQIISVLGGSKQLLFLFCSFVTNFFFCKFVLRLDSRFYFGAILVYLSVGSFYLGSLNLIRQYAAMSIFVYSLQYIRKRKFVPYLCMMLLTAFFFHASAIILIPFYFILERSISLKKRIIVVVLFLSCSRLFFILLSYTPFAPYLVLTFGTPSLSLMILFGIISLLICYLEYKYAGNGMYAIYFNMNYVSILLLCLLFFNQGYLSEIVLRMNSYFMTSYIVLVPLLVMKCKNKIGLAYVCLLLLFFYYYRNTIMEGERYSLVPYSMDFIVFN